MENKHYDETQKILSQLQAVEGRFEELSIKITLPEVISDAKQFRALMKEHAQLSELNDMAIKLRGVTEEIDNVNEMLNDPDLKDMAEAELIELEEQLNTLTHEAKIMLLPKDPDDDKSAVIEVRAGAGGDEAGLFGAELLRMYMHYAASQGWTYELMDDGATEIGGVKEAVMLVSGKNVFSKMKFESGVHRVQRVPVTESGGRIHTSTATVAVLPEAEEVEIDIDPNDLRIDTYRASGAGGQHVNRTDSAIRITHIPTGLVVTSQDQRSQIQNREKAMRVLRSRLLDLKREETENEYSGQRRLQVGSGDRSERIRTYNYPQGRVTDHRIGLTLYKLNDIIEGDLSEIIEALTLAEQEKRMQEQ